MKGEAVQIRNAEKALERGVKSVKQVCQLPEAMQKAIRELLVQGATIEGAAQSVNEREAWNEAGKAGKPTRYHVSSEAIRDYYNADRELQRERAHSLVEGTEAITRSLGKNGDLKDGEARYVQAVVMTGLARINDKDAPLSIKDALRARAELVLIRLKIRLGEVRASQVSWHRAYEKSQKALVEQKKEFVFEQTVKLRDMMRKLEKKKNLTPETFQRIQETYGILAEHVAKATLESSVPKDLLPVTESDADQDGIEPESLYFTREDEVEGPKDEMRRIFKERKLLEEGKSLSD